MMSAASSAGARGERALDLPRTPFVLDRSQRQADLLEALASAESTGCIKSMLDSE